MAEGRQKAGVIPAEAGPAADQDPLNRTLNFIQNL
jgi:hypothetical protein